MNISSICTRRMVSVDGDSTLAQAAAMMREQHVGALIVTQPMDGGACVTGVVTDRDMVVEVLAQGIDPGGIRVADLASQTLASAREDMDLSGAMAVMETHGVRRLLVTDAQDEVVGVVSLDDLMDACAKELAGLSRVIRSGMQRESAELDDAQPPSPLPLRFPAVGTAGCNSVLE